MELAVMSVGAAYRKSTFGNVPVCVCGGVEGELPEVELPEVELPEVELPDVELPDVELPDVDPLEDVEGDSVRYQLVPSHFDVKIWFIACITYQIGRYSVD
jgi:hypothetical protein